MADSGDQNLEYYDVIIIGAGVSGIDAAYRLQTECPERSYAILESRNVLGGTWSFWKYPGFRSDSYMSAYAFSWFKWPEVQGIADGDAIWRYVEAAAASQGIDKKIRYSHRVTAGSWSTPDACWTLTASTPEGTRKLKTPFVFHCAGYYDYETPFESPIPGLETFKGTVAVPQFWPQNLDYSGKKMVLIGSGATAITLLPVLAKTAGHLTQLQRSPSYVFSVTAVRPIDKISRWFLPEFAARFISYWSMMFTEIMFIGFLLHFPQAARKFLRGLMAKQVPKGVSMDKHFNPSYKPFQQRLGMCPDGDFFKALKQPNVDIVTDHIDTVTADGIKTRDGTFIGADIIIPATGLKVSPIGGAKLDIDGEPVEIGSKFVWRGCMIEGIPNAGVVLGYFTNSWTPGADVGVMQIIKVLRMMQKKGCTMVTPTMRPGEREKLEATTFFDTNATYIVSARDRIPKVAKHGIWTGRRSWLTDWVGDLWNGVEKGLVYSGAKAKSS